jgi:potassium uptake TrkH family protein
MPDAVQNILLSVNPLLSPHDLTRIYLVTTQLFLILAFFPPLLRTSSRIMASNIQPAQLMIFSFLFLIAVGTALLSLPRATVAQHLPFLDALFTATSAVCVTGLIVVDTATTFTPLGHTILMLLMQIGGLGIMTLTTFFAFIVGGGARLKEYSTLQSLLSEESLGKIKQTIVQITLVTFIIEAVGTVALYRFTGLVPFRNEAEHWFFALFHSISAFCNAGFTLTTENLAQPLLQQNTGVLTTVMVLIVLGGIGFPVMVNLGSMVVRRRSERSPRRLTVHTKLVVITTGLLIVGGTFGLLLLEYNGSAPFGPQLLTAAFHAVSARTAGFAVLSIGTLSPPSLFLLILLMWVGASPGSTGGGVKTSTVALAFLNIVAIASGRHKVEVFRKRVSDIAITKAFSTVLLSVTFISLALFCLLLTESAPLEHLLFEVVSAVSTVGLSMGITPQLTPIGKSIIIVCMVVGRVGLLAVAMALVRRKEEGFYEYTEENVLVT